MSKPTQSISIPASFLAHFYQKPPMWWVFWWRVFADLNTSGGQVMYSQPTICAWLGVSRTTLQRIVDFGTKNYQGGQQVGSKWADGKLIISILEDFEGQQVGSKWAETLPAPPKSKLPQKVDAQPRREFNALFGQMIAIYDDWIRKLTGLPSKIDGAQGKAIKSIIVYLEKAANESGKNNGSEEAINIQIKNSWTYILGHWDILDDFTQKQIKLTQINSNLQSIILQLRKPSNTPSDSRKTKFDQAKENYFNSLNNE